jgi:hypothetical protein
VKPENFLMTQDPSESIKTDSTPLVLADFGLSAVSFERSALYRLHAEFIKCQGPWST